MNEIEKLKAFKPPLWSRLYGNFTAWRSARAARRKVHHITTLTVWVKCNGAVHCGYFQLYERGDGVRSFKYFAGRTLCAQEEFSMYHMGVVPWLHHRFTNAKMIEIAQENLKVPTEWR